MNRTMQRACRTLILAILATLVGCRIPSESALFKPRRFQRQDQAGSVHVALIAAAPWNRYARAMQPTFDLTAEEALAKVIATTQLLEEKTLDASSLLIRLSTPRTTKEVEKVTTESVGPKADGGPGETTETTTEEATTTEKTSPGDANHQFANAPQGDRRAKDLGPADFLKGATLDVDPALQYKVATSLFQEVQMLNRFVADAARRKGFAPYLVRLQVTLMPSARHEPYDAYSNIAFFNGNDFASSAEPKAASGAIDAQNGGKAADRNPIVVPLLVTDNLEKALASRTADVIRQQAFALLALVRNFAGATEYQRFQERFESVLGHDLNALFTIGRLTDNAVRVRLGALHEATARYAMTPRTHDVTLLVLVPRSVAQLKVMTRTVFADAEYGTPLYARTAAEIRSRLEAIVLDGYAERAENDEGTKGFVFDTQNKVGFLPAARIPELFFAAQTNNRAEFEKLLPKSYRFLDQLWVELLDLAIGSQWQTLDLELPEYPKPRLAQTEGAKSPSPPPTPVHSVLIRDDRSTAEVVIGGASGLDPEAIRANLEFKNSSGSVKDVLYPETATAGSTLVLRFPSLRRRGLLHQKASGAVPNNSLVLRVVHERLEEEFAWTFNQFYLEIPDPKPGEEPKKRLKSIQPTVPHIPADTGAKGSLTVFFVVGAEKPTDYEAIEIKSRKFVCFVDNAEVETVDGLQWEDASNKPPNQASGFWFPPVNANDGTHRVRFELAKLAKGVKVQFRVVERIEYVLKSDPRAAVRKTDLPHDTFVFDVTTSN